MVFLCEGRLSWTEMLMMSPMERRAFAYVKRIQRGETIDWERGEWVHLPPGATLSIGKK